MFKPDTLKKNALIIFLFTGILLSVSGFANKKEIPQKKAGQDAVSEIFFNLERHPQYQNKNILWKENFFPMKKNSKNGKLAIILQWEFEQKEHYLVLNGKKLKPKNESFYQVAIPIKNQNVPIHIEILEIGPKGEVSKEKIKLTPKEGKSTSQKNKPKTQQSPLFSLGLGASYLTHQESGYSGLTQYGLSSKLNFGIPFGESSFDFAANVFSTFIGLSEPKGDFITFVGSNIRFGYSLLPHTSPFKINIMLGAYYITTFA